MEAFTYDGTPLYPCQYDAAVAADQRAAKLQKADGTLPLPARPAALLAEGRLSELTKPPMPPATVNEPTRTTTPHPNGNSKKGGVALHVMNDHILERVHDPYHGGLAPIRPSPGGADLQTTRFVGDDGAVLLIVTYVRMESEAWKADDQHVGAAVGGAVHRAATRADGTDNAVTSGDPTGGVYVNVGATVLPQHQHTAALPRGSTWLSSVASDKTDLFAAARRRLMASVQPPDAAAATECESNLCAYELARFEEIRKNQALLAQLGLGTDVSDSRLYERLRYMVPYRHINSREPPVRTMTAAVARVMAAGAHAVRVATPEVYEAWWAPIEAAPIVAPALLHPSPAMQRGECGGDDEWAVAEGLPAPADDATMPFGHLAARVGGIPDECCQRRLRMAWQGVSNIHVDPVDAWRRFGVPIVYVPHISPAARTHRRYRSSHSLPSSDLIWCEGRRGGRSVRIVTCTHGWVCIVHAHYESQLHSGSMQAHPQTGAVIDPDTQRPYLEAQLVPGVELLRAVCYSLARVDAWCVAVQAAYESRGDGTAMRTAAQEALLCEVYEALDAPLDERFRMLHPWLPRKADDAHSAPWGPRPEY